MTSRTKALLLLFCLLVWNKFACQHARRRYWRLLCWTDDTTLIEVVSQYKPSFAKGLFSKRISYSCVLSMKHSFAAYILPQPAPVGRKMSIKDVSYKHVITSNVIMNMQMNATSR